MRQVAVERDPIGKRERLGPQQTSAGLRGVVGRQHDLLGMILDRGFDEHTAAGDDQRPPHSRRQPQERPRLEPQHVHSPLGTGDISGFSVRIGHAAGNEHRGDFLRRRIAAGPRRDVMPDQQSDDGHTGHPLEKMSAPHDLPSLRKTSVRNRTLNHRSPLPRSQILSCLTRRRETGQ